MTVTEEKLIGILKEGLRLDAALSVTPEMVIFGKEGLGLDSVDVLEIAVLLDKHFGVLIEENEAVRSALRTVGTLAAFIDGRARD